MHFIHPLSFANSLFAGLFPSFHCSCCFYWFVSNCSHRFFFMMDYVILLLVLYVHSRYYWRIRLYFRVVLYPESAMKGVFETSRENRAFLHSFAQFCAQIFQKFDKKMIKSLVQLSLETHFPMIELTGFGFYPTPSLSNSSSRFSFKFINLLHLWTLGCTKINEIHSPLCDFQNQIVSGFFSLNFL